MSLTGIHPRSAGNVTTQIMSVVTTGGVLITALISGRDAFMPSRSIPGSEIGSDASPKQMAQLACQPCEDSMRSSAAAGSGHQTSSLCAADLTAPLARHLRDDWRHPDLATTDHTYCSSSGMPPGRCTPMSMADGVVSRGPSPPR
jgi:hypothetical protein